MCIKLEKGTDKKITSFQNVVQTVNRVQMFRGVDGIDLCNEQGIIDPENSHCVSSCFFTGIDTHFWEK